MDKTNDKQIILDVSKETFLKLLVYANGFDKSIPEIIIYILNLKLDAINFNDLIAQNPNLRWFDLITDLERGYYD